MARDASLSKSIALPAAAGSVYTAGLAELPALSSRGVTDTPSEFVVEAPALDTTELPDTKTCVYDLQCDDQSDFSTAVTFAAAVITQTGAGGAGAAAATARVGLPTNHKQYWRLKCTTSSGAGDCSGSTAWLWLDCRHDVLV